MKRGKFVELFRSSITERAGIECVINVARIHGDDVDEDFCAHLMEVANAFKLIRDGNIRVIKDPKRVSDPDVFAKLVLSGVARIKQWEKMPTKEEWGTSSELVSILHAYLDYIFGSTFPHVKTPLERTLESVDPKEIDPEVIAKHIEQTRMFLQTVPKEAIAPSFLGVVLYGSPEILTALADAIHGLPINKQSAIVHRFATDVCSFAISRDDMQIPTREECEVMLARAKDPKTERADALNLN